MKFWQIAVIVIALVLITVVELRLMPEALSGARNSEWLGVVVFGFMLGQMAITAGVIYGVWKLGGSSLDNLRRQAAGAFL